MSGKDKKYFKWTQKKLEMIFVHVNASSQVSGPQEKKVKNFPVVEAFIQALKKENWKPDDEDCVQATLVMLDGVKNNTLWATWIWDSMQLPTGSLYGSQAYLGNYDQCLQAPWTSSHPDLRSQYCLVEVRGQSEQPTRTFGAFDDTTEYYRTLTKDARFFNHHFFGACLPSTCAPSSVSRISRILLQLSHLPEIEAREVFLDPRNCETAGQEKKYSSGYYVFGTVVGVLIALSVISTLSDNGEAKQTFMGTISKSFSLKRNYQSLFSTGPDEVSCLHGMRVFTAISVVIIHEGFFTLQSPVINALDVDKFLQSPVGRIFMHVEIVVDTFFAMSGLLLVRGLMMGKQKNLVYTLLKRYIRLMGPSAFCILLLLTIGEDMMSGPMGKSLMRCETDFCQKYWWINFLMINTQVATNCHSVTWYISCDFQLAILGTFLFYVFKKNRKLGVAAFVSVAVALTLHLGYTVHRKQLEVLPFNLKAIVETRHYTVLNDVYLPSHARAGPYLVGMILGYAMTVYRPAEYRNVVNKRWSSIIIGISVLVCCAMVSVGAIFSGRPYDAVEAAVVVATNRVVWAIAVCCVVAVCEYGSLNNLRSFLGWSGFVPLSKLSYCLYLVHSIVFQVQKYSLRNAPMFSPYFMIVNVYGILVIASGCSFVLHLFVEAPLINISNELFAKKSSTAQKEHLVPHRNGTSSQNGQNGLKVKSS